MINLFYGMKPCISTFLQFETVEHFEFIRQVLEYLHFCKLNEKHLKPMKRTAKGKAVVDERPDGGVVENRHIILPPTTAELGLATGRVLKSKTADRYVGGTSRLWCQEP